MIDSVPVWTSDEGQVGGQGISSGAGIAGTPSIDAPASVAPLIDAAPRRRPVSLPARALTSGLNRAATTLGTKSTPQRSHVYHNQRSLKFHRESARSCSQRSCRRTSKPTV